MGYRLGKFEFFKTNQLKALQEEGLTWRVCEDYEINEPSGDGASAYVRAKYPSNQRDRWREYKPLNDVSDLFLKFARLHEGGISAEVIRDWTRKYGLLGYVPDVDAGMRSEDTIAISWEQLRRARSSKEGNIRDGSLSVFREEAARAAGVLAMYEAAIVGDNGAAKKLILEESPFIGGRLWPTGPKHLPLFEEDHELEVSLVAEWVEEVFEGDYLRYCLWTSKAVVEGTVHDFCYPMLRLGTNGRDPSEVVDVWAFENLLGAMYLQMYWLMGSGGNTTRCRWCNRIISLAKPHPDAKKRPQHKKFCDAQCRQKHHYYHEVRPNRQNKDLAD